MIGKRQVAQRSNYALKIVPHRNEGIGEHTDRHERNRRVQRGITDVENDHGAMLVSQNDPTISQDAKLARAMHDAVVAQQQHASGEQQRLANSQRLVLREVRADEHLVIRQATDSNLLRRGTIAFPLEKRLE